jgi:hypothetical protein
MGSSVLRPVVPVSSRLRPDYTANERGLSRQKSKRPSFCTPGFEKPMYGLRKQQKYDAFFAD